MELLLVVGLLITGYLTGRYFEQNHYKRIREKEAYFREKIEVVAHGKFYTSEFAKNPQLLEGNVVVASDYFKNFIAAAVSIIGGRVKTYETLLDRGRREAVIRLLEKAEAVGANKVINLRIDAVNVNNTHGKKGMPIIECFAYGTAINE